MVLDQKLENVLRVVVKVMVNGRERLQCKVKLLISFG